MTNENTNTIEVTEEVKSSFTPIQIPSGVEFGLELRSFHFRSHSKLTAMMDEEEARWMRINALISSSKE